MFEVKKASEFINGTFGELYIDGIKLSVNKTKVFLQNLNDIKGKGFFSVLVIGQELQRMIIEKQKNNHEFTILIGCDDPDSNPQSKIELYGVKFNNISLYGFENSEISKDIFPFTFKDYKYKYKNEV